jgi:hypothetical protein
MARFICSSLGVFSYPTDDLGPDGTDEKTMTQLSRWNTPASYAGQVSRNPMPVHINLRLAKSRAPGNGKPVEIVIKEFSFQAGR